VSKVAIVGGGLTKFGVRKATYKELAQEAGKAVFEDVPNLDKKDVDSLFLGSAASDRMAFQAYPAPLVAEQVGVQPDKVIMRTELACASGQAAMRAAYGSIASGLSDIALVMGVEKMNTPNMAETQTTMAAVMDREWDGVNGMSAPPFFALVMMRHMHEYGTTREQLGMVSVKNHDNSASNPFAQFQKKFTLEDVVNSVEISKPIRLLDWTGPVQYGQSCLESPQSHDLASHEEGLQERPDDGRQGRLRYGVCRGSRLLHHRGDRRLRGRRNVQER
jgi:acetyl-CoA C-acetyltransferase